MASLPQLGVGLPVSGAWATPENMVHVATRAEELGYTSLWSFQRLLHPVDEDWGAVYHGVVDPVTALAFVAGCTSRIRLGLAVVNLPFYSPIVLSKALTTVDIVSKGRLDVGLGLGWARAGVRRRRRRRWRGAGRAPRSSSPASRPSGPSRRSSTTDSSTTCRSAGSSPSRCSSRIHRC